MSIQIKTAVNIPPSCRTIRSGKFKSIRVFELILMCLTDLQQWFVIFHLESTDKLNFNQIIFHIDFWDGEIFVIIGNPTCYDGAIRRFYDDCNIRQRILRGFVNNHAAYSRYSDIGVERQIVRGNLCNGIVKSEDK